jgi:hypothetical protein
MNFGRFSKNNFLKIATNSNAHLNNLPGVLYYQFFVKKKRGRGKSEYALSLLPTGARPPTSSAASLRNSPGRRKGA